jgi:hypothetical protein
LQVRKVRFVDVHILILTAIIVHGKALKKCIGENTGGEEGSFLVGIYLELN